MRSVGQLNQDLINDDDDDDDNNTNNKCLMVRKVAEQELGNNVSVKASLGEVPGIFLTYFPTIMY